METISTCVRKHIQQFTLWFILFVRFSFCRPYYSFCQRSPVPVHEISRTTDRDIYIADCDISHITDQNRSFERVEQWLLQQNDFVAVPPPDTVSLSSTKSNSGNADPHRLDYLHPQEFPPLNYSQQYRSEGHINTSYQGSQNDCTEYLGFRGLESRRYYSPNLNRRRPTDSRESQINQIFTSTPSALDHVDSGYGTQIRRSEAVTRSYQDQIDKVNTFPRRRRFVRGHLPIPRSLLQSKNMGQQLDKHDPTTHKERLLTPHESVTPKNNKNLKKPSIRPKSWADTRKSTAALNASQCDNKIPYVNKNNISRDTQRLLAGNLPDVALTAAKALHKRELSDSLPKVQYDGHPNHVRMWSAPEQRDFEPSRNKTAIFREETSKKASNLLRKVKAFSWPKRAIVQSYPDTKCSSIQPQGNSSLPHEDKVLPSRGSPLNKTESGYNTEKSEETKQENYPAEEEILEQEIVEMQQNISSLGEMLLCDHKSSSEESECPPERPPLPNSRDLRKTISSSPSNTLSLIKTDRTKLEITDNTNTSLPKSENFESRDKEFHVDKNLSELSFHSSSKVKISDSSETMVEPAPVKITSPKRTCKINIKPRTVEYKVIISSNTDLPQSNRNDANSSYSDTYDKNDLCCSTIEDLQKETKNEISQAKANIVNEDEFANVPCSPRKISSLTITPRKIKPDACNDTNSKATESDVNEDEDTELNNNNDKHYKYDCNYPAIDIGDNMHDLSKSVSMSLRDLIRIHEDEIARVCGRPKRRDCKSDKRKSCIVEPRKKPRQQDHWKRHTTIGLISDQTQFDSDHAQFDVPDNAHFRTQSDDIDRRRSDYKHEPLKPRLSLASNLNLNDTKLPLINTYLPKRSPPVVSPRSRTSANSVVSESLYESVKYNASTEQLLSPTSSCSQKSIFSRDVSIQTDKDTEKLTEDKANLLIYEEQILYLTDENERLKKQFQVEKVELKKRLDEQRKVANAYQKLEDRYRRKVHELQKHIGKCGCYTNSVKSYLGVDDDSSSRYMRLKSAPLPGVHVEPSQTSKMELFAKIINGLIFSQKISILHV